MNAHRILGPALLAALSALVQPARADWPMVRHDAKRTAIANGTSNIVEPAVVWRAYLGGSTGGYQMMALDVAEDTASEVVFISSGRMTCKRQDDSTVWQTPFLGLVGLVGVADLNGDGSAEIVAYANASALIVEAKTGKILWEEPSGEMGALGDIRVGDLDGDKKPDLLIQECSCCGASNKNTGFAYSFGAGYAAPKKLWTLPAVACGGYRSMALLDADGDGALEVTNGSGGKLSLLSGATGIPKATSPDLGTFGESSLCVARNVDGVAGDELVCIQDRAGATPSGRRLTVLKYQTSPTPNFAIAWSVDVGSTDGALQAPSDPVVDLDGDGKMEIVVGGDVGGEPRTYVYAADTGVLLATMNKARLEGTARIDAKSAVILTTDTTTLSASSFARGATPAISSRWTAADHRVEYFIDWTKPRVSAFDFEPLHIDLDGDGKGELITLRQSTPRESVATSLAATAKTIATYALPANTGSLLATVPRAAGGPSLFLAQDDGQLVGLDKSLKPLAGSVPVRFGGYYADGGWKNLTNSAAVAAMNGATAQSVFVPDSRRALLKLDASKATNASPPAVNWRRTATDSPAVVRNILGGKDAIACHGTPGLGTPAEKYEVVLLKEDGTVAWKHDSLGPARSDILAGDVNKDGTPDLVFQFGKAGDRLTRNRALSGVDGSVLWTSADYDNTYPPAGFALADWNGDGSPDVLFQASPLRVLSGLTGTQIASGGAAGDTYYMPTVFDVDGDGVEEVTLHGGYSPSRTMKHDLASAVWTGTEDDRPYPYAAIASCADGNYLVGGSWAFPSRLKITKLAGSGAGTAKTLVLAGGASYANEAAALTAGARGGQLTSVSVHPDISGDKKHVAFVGSRDGHLYQVDPCGAKLLKAIPFAAAVGETVFGDTDGDGKDEIIVSVADGYLYGLRNQLIPAPEFVSDLEPAVGALTDDIDVVTGTTSLTAKWAPVAGATKYEVAATDGAGAYLTTPPWRDVGNVTQATVDSLSLAPGKDYFFAVRAVGPAGTGPDKVSDGVVVAPGGDAGVDGGADAGPLTDTSILTDGGEPPPAEDSASCSCAQAGAGGASSAGLAGVFMITLGAFLARRPRSSTNRSVRV